MRFIIFLMAVLLMMPSLGLSKKEKVVKKKRSDTAILAGLKFRSIGPSFTSGRISDFAVNPKKKSEYYVAVSSGNIWKTQNSGITFKPVFEKYGSYSIGALAMDPGNPNVVWAGTGENNHQRALAYGDGIYKTVDGGKSWKNMGLKNSRHIGKIIIDPGNGNTVYVAAEGSTWGPGGDRGVYKTIDGGKNWKKILSVSEHTGISSMAIDPRHSNILYAAAEQRRRHVFTKIGGGPESALYKSEDGGKNWRKLTAGLPKGDKGGIAIAISPVNPDYVYVMIEGSKKTRGFFKSTDRGESFKKVSSHASSGQYYNEIFCDPKDINRIFSVETYTHYTEDGGKTWKRFGLKNRHVDDHALWIDPDNTDHILIGGDGGVYETFDMGAYFDHKKNLPVIQFYRVAVDNSYPFYHVFGGTQDNGSMGGPSNSLSRHGVSNGEWYTTNWGDGFWTQIDPEDQNIGYAESQYGNIVRFDRRSGERTYIRPQPRKGEKTYKWNWNTPYLISPHSNTRLYIAANKVFRSDDRGDSWQVISDDITSGVDRNTWRVMGKYWGAEAVAKDVSTSQFGTAVSIDESRLQEDLLYVGTDDGVIQVTEDAGKNWRKMTVFPGVPKYTYVSDIHCSRFNKDTVFASFDNMKRDDFKPYLLKSQDKGKSWVSIASNLPKNGTVHSIVQDFKNSELLFAGTEFGIFFSPNGGKKWIQLKAGIPTISVKDIAIQERENDLVLATFGRGFYILDNYAPLRDFNDSLLNKEAHLFEVKNPLQYIQKGKVYGQGENVWLSKNPAYGAVFTYYIKQGLKTEKQKRMSRDRRLFKKGEKITVPDWDMLRKESMEEMPHLVFTISDMNGNVIRELRTRAKKGINRIAWDLKYLSLNPLPLKLDKGAYNPLKKFRPAYPVLPGKYQVYLSKLVKGKLSRLTEARSFEVKRLQLGSLSAKDQKALDRFHRKLITMSGVLNGAVQTQRELMAKTLQIKQSLLLKPELNRHFYPKLRKIELALREIDFKFNGHRAKASREEIPPSHMPLLWRLGAISYSRMLSLSKPAANMVNSMNIIREELKPLLTKLKELKDILDQLDMKMTQKGAVWTSGRIPEL